jgi:hypothetical protein
MQQVQPLQPVHWQQLQQLHPQTQPTQDTAQVRRDWERTRIIHLLEKILLKLGGEL